MTTIIYGYFDGSCSDPVKDGVLGFGYHANEAGNSLGSLIKKSEGGDVIGTNNESEMIALYKLLYSLSELRPNSFLIIRGDSKIVIDFMNGVKEVRNQRLRKLFTAIKSMEVKFEKVIYEHIPRKENSLADKLSKECAGKVFVDYYNYRF